MASESNTATTVRALVTTVASVAASAVLFRTVVNDLLPYQFREYVSGTISHFFSNFSNTTTIVIDEYRDFAINHMFIATEAYLSSKLSPSTRHLKVNKGREDDSGLDVTMDKGVEMEDVYLGSISCKWQLISHERKGDLSLPWWHARATETRHYMLSFHKRHRETVLNSYLPFVLEQWRSIKEAKKGLKIYAGKYCFDDMDAWVGIDLDHPATFETLAMDRRMKTEVMDDLARFVKRKEYYRKVGKAWKRGYLLYGPPGTGKSSLIAAMANYLRFDIYDLDLSQVENNSDLQRRLMATANRSILVVEDIDCSIDFRNRREEEEEEEEEKEKEKGKESLHGDKREKRKNDKVTLSGLLNLLDGLWSSCGEERIIVFTTNYKDRLDPAMLRPGRMDMHIHMSYCTPDAFRVLASNYHSIDNHHLFQCIDQLLTQVDVTPAEVAEELLRNDEAEMALKGFVSFLEGKKRHKENVDGSSPLNN